MKKFFHFLWRKVLWLYHNLFPPTKSDTKKWSIQVTVSKRDLKDKPIRATFIFWTEAKDIPSAYKNAEKILQDHPDAKFGVCMLGHHPRLF